MEGWTPADDISKTTTEIPVVPISKTTTWEMRDIVRLPGFKVLRSVCDPRPTMRTKSMAATRSLQQHPDDSSTDTETLEAVDRLHMEMRCIEEGTLGMTSREGFLPP